MSYFISYPEMVFFTFYTKPLFFFLSFPELVFLRLPLRLYFYRILRRYFMSNFISYPKMVFLRLTLRLYFYRNLSRTLRLYFISYPEMVFLRRTPRLYGPLDVILCRILGQQMYFMSYPGTANVLSCIIHFIRDVLDFFGVDSDYFGAVYTVAGRW